MCTHTLEEEVAAHGGTPELLGQGKDLEIVVRSCDGLFKRKDYKNFGEQYDKLLERLVAVVTKCQQGVGDSGTIAAIQHFNEEPPEKVRCDAASAALSGKNKVR